MLSRESGTGADASRGPGLHYSEETQAVIPQPGWDHLQGQEAILSLTPGQRRPLTPNSQSKRENSSHPPNQVPHERCLSHQTGTVVVRK